MIDIRKAALDDLDTLLDMWLEFMESHDTIVSGVNPLLKVYLEKKDDAKDIVRKFIVKNLTSEDSLLNIAFCDGAAAGYCLAYIKDAVPIFKVDSWQWF